MRRDDDDDRCEEDDDDEIFSDFYSYCAERVSFLSLRRRKDEDEEWHDDDEEDDEEDATTIKTTIRAVLEDATRLVIFFDEEEEKEAKSSRCYPSLEKKRVDAYRDARRRRGQKRNERGEDAKTTVTTSLSSSTLIFAGVEELLTVIAEKTTKEENKGEEMDISKTSMREAWATRLPKEHFVNAMLNADASDSRAKKTNKAMADMFKECLAIECNGSHKSTFSTSFFETGGFLQDREGVDVVGNSKTKAQKYFRD